MTIQQGFGERLSLRLKSMGIERRGPRGVGAVFPMEKTAGLDVSAFKCLKGNCEARGEQWFLQSSSE